MAIPALTYPSRRTLVLLAAAVCLTVSIFPPAPAPAESAPPEKVAAESRPLSAADVRDLQTKYRDERQAAEQAGLGKKFAAEVFQRAQRLAEQGDAALAAGRLLDAREAFREALWQLPALPPDFPADIARVFGNQKLRHSGGIGAIAYSPDGRRLAAISIDGSAKIWDTRSGRELRSYDGHLEASRAATENKTPACAIAFSPDGKHIASACADKLVKVWDADSGKELHSLAGHANAVTCVAFSADGKTLASGGEDGAVRLWTVATGKETRLWKRHKGIVASVAFSPNGKWLASGDKEGLVWVVDAATGDPLFPGLQVHGNGGGVAQVVFRPDSKAFATCGEADGLAKVYEISDEGRRGAILHREFRGHTLLVAGVAFSPDGKTLATCGGESDKGERREYSIRLWDAATGLFLRDFRGHLGPINAVAFSPDGSQLASGGADQAVRLWGLEEGYRRLAGHQGCVWAVGFSPDGSKVVSAGADRTVRVWDAESGRELHSLTGHQAAVLTVQYSPDGKFLLSGGGDKVLKLWDAESGREVRTFTGHTATVTAAAFSRDGQRIVSGGADRLVKVWDTATGKELHSLAGHKAVVTAVAFHPDGKQVASGGGDFAVKLWDLSTLKEGVRAVPRVTLAGPTAAVSALAISPDGKLLAAGGVDKRILVWNLAAQPAGSQPFLPETTFSDETSTSPVSTVAFSPDSRTLASAGGDQVVKLWDLNKRQKQRTLRGHKDWIGAVAFSPDGRRVVSAGVDHNVLLWELTGRETTQATYGHRLGVNAVAFSPDGRLLASGADDMTVKLWDAATGAEVRTLFGHKADVTALAFGPEGRFLVSGGRDKVLKLWDTTSGKELKTIEGLSGYVPAVTVAAQTKRIVAWVTPSEIHVFDLDGNRLKQQTAHEQEMNCLSFSVDGELAALGERNGGSVRIWNIAKGERVGGDLPAYQGDIGDLIFTPDRKRLITGGRNGEVKIWDLDKRQEPLRTIKAHTQAVTAFAVNADGNRFATTGDDNVVKLWETATGKELRQWKMSSRVGNLAFAPDGKHLATANYNSTLYLLECP